jgi:hypothetical protein
MNKIEKMDRCGAFAVGIFSAAQDTICHITSVHCHALAPTPAHWLDEIVVSQKGRPA